MFIYFSLLGGGWNSKAPDRKQSQAPGCGALTQQQLDDIHNIDILGP